MEVRRQQLAAAVQSARTVIEGFVEKARRGELTEAAAQAAAREALRSSRYGEEKMGHVPQMIPMPSIMPSGVASTTGKQAFHAIVRQANLGDVSAVRQCVLEAFTPYIVRIGKPPAPMLLDFEALTHKGHVWVAVLEATVAGALVQYETSEGFYIDTVATGPEQRGHGVGRELLLFAEQEAFRRGFSSLYLCTNSKMVENHALYTNIGYAELERKHMAGYDRIFYRKVLEGAQPR